MNDVSVMSAFRPDEIVVESVQWKVHRDEFWVVGGLQSSGKTDLLMTAAGLQKPAAGIVHLFGKQHTGLPESELLADRRRIGVVFENGGRMFRQLTVLENVVLPLRYHENLDAAESAERIRPILEATELMPYLHNTIAALTPPWQQRVGLARALALQPELLLLDKPNIGSRYITWWHAFLRDLTQGSIFPGHRVTCILTADDLRDWTDLGTHFAMVKKKRWHPLGGKAELSRSQEELWREITAN